MTTVHYYRPFDDKIILLRAPSLHIIGMLMWNVFWGETNFGVSRRQGFANLVPSNHPEMMAKRQK